MLWAAQDMGSNVQVWTHGSATAAAVAGLARRHRVAVTGTAADIAVLCRPCSTGPVRATGRSATTPPSASCVMSCRGLTPTPPFGWMTTIHAPSPATGKARLARDSEQAAIAQVLDEVFPHSLARPGLPGISRWWVEADTIGIAACAADAWSAPCVGLLAGVATATPSQGRGLGKSVTATALAALIQDYGAAALMVEADNAAAQSLYRSLGMTYRPVRAAAPLPARTANSAREHHLFT